jgi:hypothetical protein
MILAPADTGGKNLPEEITKLGVVTRSFWSLSALIRDNPWLKALGLRQKSLEHLGLFEPFL